MIFTVAGLVFLGVIAAGVVGIANVVRRPHAGRSVSAAATARRLVVFALLFALVIIAAIGVSGLLGRLLGSGNNLAGSDVSGLALSLAFTLIAAPSAALLWWFLWRDLDSADERESTAWSLYVPAVSTVALVTATSSLVGVLADLIGRRWDPSALATSAVWAAVWFWHRVMARHPLRSPTRLTDLGSVAGSTYGLILGAGGAVAALQTLFAAGLGTLNDQGLIVDPWWVSTLQSALWAVAGAVIWWWHWARDNGRGQDTGAANAALVAVGVVGAAVLALVGASTTVYTALRLAVDRTDPTSQILEPLPLAASMLVVGSLVWTYHRGVIAGRDRRVREAARLFISAVGLAASATGIGIIVNSSLDALTASFAGHGGRALLLGGLSALAVGGPVWWRSWQPTVTVTDPALLHATGRRVYLVAVFGLSAVVALVTLLVVGYRVFELALGDLSGEGLVERIRAPLGLLVATALVAGYHYPVWRHDRALITASAPPKRIHAVIVVTGSDPGPLVKAVGDATGATVTVWRRADEDLDGPTTAQVVHALDGVTGHRLLVVTGSSGGLDVIPLRD